VICARPDLHRACRRAKRETNDDETRAIIHVDELGTTPRNDQTGVRNNFHKIHPRLTDVNTRISGSSQNILEIGSLLRCLGFRK
jgi:hypothetical protein